MSFQAPHSLSTVAIRERSQDLSYAIKAVARECSATEDEVRAAFTEQQLANLLNAYLKTDRAKVMLKGERSFSKFSRKCWKLSGIVLSLALVFTGLSVTGMVEPIAEKVYDTIH